jgi:hypothetical protein
MPLQFLSHFTSLKNALNPHTLCVTDCHGQLEALVLFELYRCNVPYFQDVKIDVECN